MRNKKWNSRKNCSENKRKKENTANQKWKPILPPRVEIVDFQRTQLMMVFMRRDKGNTERKLSYIVTLVDQRKGRKNAQTTLLRGVDFAYHDQALCGNKTIPTCWPRWLLTGIFEGRFAGATTEFIIFSLLTIRFLYRLFHYDGVDQRSLKLYK